jgi:hypothetical protein
MPDKCPPCIESKPGPLTHTKCDKCGHYRPLKPAELAKVAKRAPTTELFMDEYMRRMQEAMAEALAATVKHFNG